MRVFLVYIQESNTVTRSRVEEQLVISFFSRRDAVDILVILFFCERSEIIRIYAVSHIKKWLQILDGLIPFVFTHVNFRKHHGSKSLVQATPHGCVVCLAGQVWQSIFEILDDPGAVFLFGRTGHIFYVIDFRRIQGYMERTEEVVNNI